MIFNRFSANRMRRKELANNKSLCPFSFERIRQELRVATSAYGTENKYSYEVVLDIEETKRLYNFLTGILESET